MIHVKNKSITLDEQIKLIREAIQRGEQKFPIDIVDTIGNDSQLYYEIESGYWERYKYNSDGDCVGYLDALGTTFGTGMDDYLNEQDQDNIFQLEAIKFNELRDVAVKHNVMIITAQQVGEVSPEQCDIFLIDSRFADNEIDYKECSDKTFKIESIRQGLNYTKEKFQTEFNQGNIPNNKNIIIRFK